MQEYHQFAHIVCTASGCPEWLNIPMPCGNRFCNVCQSQRRARSKRRMAQMVAWQSKNKQPSSRFKFLTLTLIRQTDIVEGIKFLLSSFRRLRQQQWWKSLVHGGIFVVEVVPKEDGWHIHLHAVIYGRYIPQKKLSAKWNALTGASIVWITLADPKTIVQYLTKYLTKGNKNEQETQEAGRSLKGIRLFQPFGTWHNCTPTEARPKKTCACCGNDSWYIISFRNWLDPRRTVRSRTRFLESHNVPTAYSEIEVSDEGTVTYMDEVIYRHPDSVETFPIDTISPDLYRQLEEEARYYNRPIDLDYNNAFEVG